MAVTAYSTEMRAAYSAAGDGWQQGPGHLYDRLASELVAHAPVSLHELRVLDLGAGTGAGSRAAISAGARSVIAIDAALGMLVAQAARRPPAVVGDALALPFADGSFGAVLAAFSLNHLAQPRDALQEIARVLRPGGALAASAYSSDDSHPVKAAVDAAAVSSGWRAESWYSVLQGEATPRLATPERALAEAVDAGLIGASASVERVAFDDLSPSDLVEWRLGMAHLQQFVAERSPSERATLKASALARLGDDPPALVRAFVVL